MSSFPIGIPPVQAKHRIYPPELRTAAEYGNMCSTVPIANALHSFKQKYPDKFPENSSDSKVSEVFEKWQKAFKFWNGEYSIVNQQKIEKECPQEIQAIRSHLWEIINDEDAKSAAQFANKWYVRGVFNLQNCVRSISSHWLLKIALVIATLALVVLITL